VFAFQPGRFWKSQEKIPLDKVLQVIDKIIIVEIINVKNNDGLGYSDS